MRFLFVYGTLMSGQPRNSVLADCEYHGKAVTMANSLTMYDLAEFPAVVDGGETAIKGEVYLVPDHVIGDLDRIENPDLYTRKIARVQYTDGKREGRAQGCYIYKFAPKNRALLDALVTKVPDGDWAAYIASREPKNQLKQASQLHAAAMEAVTYADKWHDAGDESMEQQYRLEAYIAERGAAMLFRHRDDLEPTRSVLFRSAATLAIQAGDLLGARQLLMIGLLGNAAAEMQQEMAAIIRVVEQSLTSHQSDETSPPQS